MEFPVQWMAAKLEFLYFGIVSKGLLLTDISQILANSDFISMQILHGNNIFEKSFICMKNLQIFGKYYSSYAVLIY